LERSRVPEPKAKVMNLEELRARLAEIAERATEMGEEFRDAEMPEEAQKEFDGLTAEASTLRAKEEKILERAKALEEFASHSENVRSGSDRGTPAFHKKEDIFDLDSLRTASPEQLKDRALRANEGARFSPTADKTRSQERIESLLEYSDTERGELAARLVLTGSPLYERAFGKAVRAVSTAGLTGEEARALALGVDANGGYAVPFQLDPTVMLQNNGTYNPIRRLARKVEIVGKEWQGITSAGISVTRDVEAAQVADNSPTFAQKTVRTNRVHGFVPFSIELDQDWGQLRSEISTMLADAKDREENTSFTLGDGTGVNANGVITTLSGNTVATAGVGAFAAADLYALEQALAPRYRTQSAAFLANHTMYNKVRQFGTTDGHALWTRLGAGMPSQLLGYTAEEASDMVATTTTGSKIILFGDFSNFIIVDRIGMQVELVPQLFGANQRPTGQRGIYAIWRNNTKILNDAAFKLLVVA
jgi:HK97 family phage major capsid protein